MDNKIANLTCFVIAASFFALLAMDATAHHGSTHSGTQPNIQITKDCDK